MSKNVFVCFYLHTCYKIVIWPLYIRSIKKGYFRYISPVNPVQVSDKRVCWCNMTWYFARYFQCQCQKHNWSMLVPTRLVIILQHIWYVKLLFLYKDLKWSSTFFLKMPDDQFHFFRLWNWFDITSHTAEDCSFHFV